jgi:hypothetical protein
MTHRLRYAVLALAVTASGAARADTIQASSTTLLLGRQEYRDGDLQTVVPLYQLIDVSASGVRTPWTSDLEVTFSTWGSLDLSNRRFWQNGADIEKRLTGDVNVGYVRAGFLNNGLSLRLGRQIVADGVARNVQLDGAEARLRLPGGFGVQGYVGSPVAPRFATRGGELAVGNIRATLATGGRLSWGWASLLEVGASAAFASDRGDPSRRDVGADLRITPVHFATLLGSAWWSLYEDRLGEASVALQLNPIRHLDVTLDFRHVAPDLFLPRNSILAAFIQEDRQDAGGSFHFGGLRWLGIDGEYHALLEEGGTGHWARLKGTAHPGGLTNTVGAELSLLRNAELDSSTNGNGYKLARLFGAKSWRELTGTLDLMGYFFDRDVNGYPRSLTGVGTVSYEFFRGWRAAVAGTAGTNPFLERQFEIMAKLVYDQTYAVREVR